MLNLLRSNGSVFYATLGISLPASVCTALLAHAVHTLQWIPELAKENAIMSNNAVWGGFTFLVGFLVVFRTSQAYSRFWDGCSSAHKMGAEWFNCCAALMAFCKYSSADREAIQCFQNTLIRLFSMLHAAALGEVEDSGETAKKGKYEEVAAFKMELIDGDAIDEASLQAIRDTDTKVHLIFQWIQELIVKNIGTGVLNIAPPILTRSFQEFARGMSHFHDALMISKVPFPFPYALTCDILLIFHWLLVPFVVSQWCKGIGWASVFSFIQVFTFWSLNMIAIQLENPFGSDPNDIDSQQMQSHMNANLRLLFRTSTMTVPVLKKSEGETQEDLVERILQSPARKVSFFYVWEGMGKTKSGRRKSNPESRNCLAKPFGTTASGASLQSLGSYASSGTLMSTWEPLEAPVDIVRRPSVELPLRHDNGGRGSARSISPNSQVNGEQPAGARCDTGTSRLSNGQSVSSMDGLPLEKGRGEATSLEPANNGYVNGRDIASDSPTLWKLLGYKTNGCHDKQTNGYHEKHGVQQRLSEGGTVPPALV